MKVWKASTARTSQKIALSSAHQSVPCFFFESASAISVAGAAVSFGWSVIGNAGSLLLVLLTQGSSSGDGSDDDECLGEGMVVGHRLMNLREVALRRHRVKPCAGAAGQFERRRARSHVDHAD